MLSYVVIELLTGRVSGDFVDFAAGGTHDVTIGAASTLSGSFPVSTAPASWQSMTVPYASALICLDDDGTTPVWGGIINERDTNETADVPLSMVTVEDYFDRRYVGTVTYTNVGQCQIVKDLVETFVADQFGLPLLRVEIDGTDTNLRTHSWADTDDKTVLSALQELSGLENGPEWTVEWERSGADGSLITPVLRVSDRLGAAAPTGLGPNVQFSMPGVVQKATYTESYKSGAGANDVMATSSGAAGARPQSPHQVQSGSQDNRPKIEYRWSPSTSTTDVSTLTAHAASVLAAMQNGALTIAMTAYRYDAPRFGSMYRLGDTIGFDLTSDAWAETLSGTARVIGNKFDELSVTPVVIVDPSSVEWAFTASTEAVAGEPFMSTAQWTATDNGDGTWTATGADVVNDGGTFQLTSL